MIRGGISRDVILVRNQAIDRRMETMVLICLSPDSLPSLSDSPPAPAPAMGSSLPWVSSARGRQNRDGLLLRARIGGSTRCKVFISTE